MKTHHLKTVQPFFDQIKSGFKTFEHRKDDRDFKVGDKVILQEYIESSETITGTEIILEIVCFLKNRAGLDADYCIFSFEVLKK